MTRTLYTVELDYDDIAASGAWTDDFITACGALGQSPGQYDLLQFINEYGTHGLATASLGKRCRSSLFMEGVGRREEYQGFRNDVETNDKGRHRLTTRLFILLLLILNRRNNSLTLPPTTTIGRWVLKSDSQVIPQNGMSTRFNFLVSQSSEQCEGRLSSNSCAGFQGTDEPDEPIVTNWTFKPIWEMNVPGFKQGAKDALKKTVENIFAESVSCSKSNCNNLGACAANVDKWDSIGQGNEVKYWSDLFDDDRCFCFGTMEGDECIDAALLTTPWPLEYVSNFDGDFQYAASYDGRRGAISGVYSLHSFRIETYGDKQRFKVSVPALVTTDLIEEEFVDVESESIKDPDSTEELINYEIYYNMTCPDGKVLSYLQATQKLLGRRHWNKIKCGRFEGWKTDDCISIGPVNTPEFEVQKFDFKCPGDRGVMDGMGVLYKEWTREDFTLLHYGLFSFSCCRLIVDIDAL